MAERDHHRRTNPGGRAIDAVRGWFRSRRADAAHAAEGGFRSYVFIPSDLEQGKILGSLIYGTNLLSVSGNYYEVNRLCA